MDEQANATATVDQPEQQPQTAVAPPPTWDSVATDPRFQQQSPAERLVTFSRWHDATYNYAQSQPNWQTIKDDFNDKASKIQESLGHEARIADSGTHFLAGPMTPDEAKYRVAEERLKNGAPIAPDLKQVYDNGMPEALQRNALESSVHYALNAARTVAGESGKVVNETFGGLADMLANQTESGVGEGMPQWAGGLIKAAQDHLGLAGAREGAVNAYRSIAEHFHQKANDFEQGRVLATDPNLAGSIGTAGAKWVTDVVAPLALMSAFKNPAVGTMAFVTQHRLQTYGEVYDQTHDPVKAQSAANRATVFDALFLGQSSLIARGLGSVLEKQGLEGILPWAVKVSAATAGNITVSQLTKAAEAAAAAPPDQKLKAFGDAFGQLSLSDTAVQAVFGIMAGSHGSEVKRIANGVEPANDALRAAARRAGLAGLPTTAEPLSEAAQAGVEGTVKGNARPSIVNVNDAELAAHLKAAQDYAAKDPTDAGRQQIVDMLRQEQDRRAKAAPPIAGQTPEEIEAGRVKLNIENNVNRIFEEAQRQADEEGHPRVMRPFPHRVQEIIAQMQRVEQQNPNVNPEWLEAFRQAHIKALERIGQPIPDVLKEPVKIPPRTPPVAAQPEAYKPTAEQFADSRETAIPDANGYRRYKIGETNVEEGPNGERRVVRVGNAPREIAAGSRAIGPVLVDKDGNIIEQGNFANAGEQTHRDLLDRSMINDNFEKAAEVFGKDYVPGQQGGHGFLVEGPDGQRQVITRDQSQAAFGARQSEEFVAKQAAGEPLAIGNAPRNAPEERISTRSPWAKNATENPHEQVLETGVENILNNPDHAKALAADLRQYLPKELITKNDAQQIENAVEFFKRNKLVQYQMAKRYPWAARSLKQYVGYNVHGQNLAEQWGFTPEQIFGAESALSPQRSPDASFSMTRRLAQMMNEAEGVTFNQDMYDAAMAAITSKNPVRRAILRKAIKGLAGKEFFGLDDPIDKAIWARAYDATHNSPQYHMITPEGARGDLERTQAGAPARIQWPSYQQISKGIRALEGEPLSQVLDTHKISSYFNSKVAPTEPNGDYVSDTHDAAAGWLNSVPSAHPIIASHFGGPAKAETGETGMYALQAEAGRRAAAEVGEIPKEFQALIWTHQRGFLSPRVQPKENVAKIQALWEDAHNGKISENEAREQTLKIASQAIPEIPEPAWTRQPAGPGGAVAAEAQPAGEQGKLPSAGEHAGEPGPGNRGPNTAGVEGQPPTAGIGGVKVGPGEEWLAEALAQAGQKRGEAEQAQKAAARNAFESFWSPEARAAARAFVPIDETTGASGRPLSEIGSAVREGWSPKPAQAYDERDTKIGDRIRNIYGPILTGDKALFQLVPAKSGANGEFWVQADKQPVIYFDAANIEKELAAQEKEGIGPDLYLRLALNEEIGHKLAGFTAEEAQKAGADWIKADPKGARAIAERYFFSKKLSEQQRSMLIDKMLNTSEGQTQFAYEALHDIALARHYGIDRETMYQKAPQTIIEAAMRFLQRLTSTLRGNVDYRKLSPELKAKIDNIESAWRDLDKTWEQRFGEGAKKVAESAAGTSKDEQAKAVRDETKAPKPPEVGTANRNLTPEEIEAVNKTARAAGAVGGRAITPRYVAETIKPNETVLNFGAGKPNAEGKYPHSEIVAAKGNTVDNFDIGKNAVGEATPHDVTFASNVLNVQPDEATLRNTLIQIKNAVKPGGRAIMNFANEPRKNDMNAEQVATAIKDTFGVEPTVVGGTKAAPLWEVRRPVPFTQFSPLYRRLNRGRMFSRDFRSQERNAGEIGNAPREGEDELDHNARRALFGLPPETDGQVPPANVEAKPANTQPAANQPGGIAQRIADVRQAGVEPMAGEVPLDIIERGRKRIADGESAEARIAQLNALKAPASPDDFALFRARMEQLQKESNAAGGVTDQEANFWNSIKPFQKQWSDSGWVMQGATDLDTGSVVGLEREFAKVTGRKMSPVEKDIAQKIVDDVKKAADTRTSHEQNLLKELTNAANKAKTKVPTDIDSLANVLKKYFPEKPPEIGAAPAAPTPIGKIPQDVKIAIWQYMRDTYLNGAQYYSLESLEKQVAGDFSSRGVNITPLQIREIIAEPKALRTISDAAYGAQTQRQQLITAARIWMDEADRTPLQNTLIKAWDGIRSLVVLGHANAPLTHAGFHIFWPEYWKQEVPSLGISANVMLGNLWGISPEAAYQTMRREVTEHALYNKYIRAGLRIKWGTQDDVGRYLQSGFFGKLGIRGSMAMDTLKWLRVKLMDAEMSKLKEDEISDPETIRRIADLVNNQTGILSAGTKGARLASSLNGVAFAPQLEFARWKNVILNPIEAARLYMKGDTATPAERAFRRQVLQKTAKLAAGYLTALGVNQAILSASGSDDKINFLDPTSSDWLGFKGDGHVISPPSNALAPLRLVLGALAAPFVKNARNDLGDRMKDYVLGKLHPGITDIKEIIDGKEAYTGRPLPWVPEKQTWDRTKAAAKPALNWYEYIASKGPIPLAATVQETAQALINEGAEPDVAKVITAASIGGLGGLLAVHSHEYRPPKKAHEVPWDIFSDQPE